MTRPQRNRRPPQYLSDYVTSKQATTLPEWMMKVNWLKQEAKDGKFKGLEMELARAIMEIMKGTAENCTVEDVRFRRGGIIQMTWKSFFNRGEDVAE